MGIKKASELVSCLFDICTDITNVLIYIESGIRIKHEKKRQRCVTEAAECVKKCYALNDIFSRGYVC